MLTDNGPTDDDLAAYTGDRDPTPHPIDIEDLRREMEDLAGDALARDSRWAGTVSPVEALAILDLLAAAEHRATRAEAQSAIRGRAVAIYQARAARAERAEDKSLAGWGEAQDGWHEADLRAERAEAERDEWRQTALDERGAALDALEQIKVREARIKAVRELHQQSELIRYVPRSMRQGHDDDQPFHYCTGCDGARYPCATIRALDATTTQETA